MIKLLCYELYKLDWKKSHNITPEMEAESIKDYYIKMLAGEAPNTYEEGLWETGSNGQLYVSYPEFKDEEYLCKPYMERLLGNAELIELYHKDINSAWKAMDCVIDVRNGADIALICAYKTQAKKDLGVVIAEINPKTGEVNYISDLAKTDQFAQQKIKQVLKGYGLRG